MPKAIAHDDPCRKTDQRDIPKLQDRSAGQQLTQGIDTAFSRQWRSQANGR
jgi:hypothetical protein